MENDTFFLKNDLVKKLDDLCWISDHPAFFVSEYFYDVRNSIDYDAEVLLEELKVKNFIDQEEKKREINHSRLELIGFLKDLEEKTLIKLSNKIKCSNGEYTDLKQRIDHFLSIVFNQADVNKFEYDYVMLACEIAHQRDSLEKRLIDNQTIIYVGSKSGETLGVLIYLPTDYLNPAEIECIK